MQLYIRDSPVDFVTRSYMTEHFHFVNSSVTNKFTVDRNFYFIKLERQVFNMSFEELVKYATNGSMHESKVCAVTEALKKEKLVLMQRLIEMPSGEERKEGYRNLHKATIQLYKAVSYTLKEEKGMHKKVYKPVPALVNMVMCYDEH